MREKASMSWGVARLAGMIRFLRPLDSALLCSSIWLDTSAGMPAFACHPVTQLSGGCQSIAGINSDEAHLPGVAFPS